MEEKIYYMVFKDRKYGVYYFEKGTLEQFHKIQDNCMSKPCDTKDEAIARIADLIDFNNKMEKQRI